MGEFKADYSEDVELCLREAGTAVLLVLALQQAVYHTIRARLLDDSREIPSFHISAKADGGHVFRIENPGNTTSNDTSSKDRDPLAFIAKRISEVPNEPYRYTTEGPARVEGTTKWYFCLNVNRRSEDAAR
jgi:hypothetical protein